MKLPDIDMPYRPFALPQQNTQIRPSAAVAAKRAYYLAISRCEGGNCYKFGDTDADDVGNRFRQYVTHNPCVEFYVNASGGAINAGKFMEQAVLRGSGLRQQGRTEWYCGDLSPDLEAILNEFIDESQPLFHS